MSCIGGGVGGGGVVIGHDDFGCYVYNIEASSETTTIVCALMVVVVVVGWTPDIGLNVVVVPLVLLRKRIVQSSFHYFRFGYTHIHTTLYMYVHNYTRTMYTFVCAGGENEIRKRSERVRKKIA